MFASTIMKIIVVVMFVITVISLRSQMFLQLAVFSDENKLESDQQRHSFKAEIPIVFHVGKGGGGTLKKDLEFDVKWVHPKPKSSIIKQLQNGPSKTLIVNIRDPIDRFVSAFNWRNTILCHPNDKRHIGMMEAVADPISFCKVGYGEEEMLLHETYESKPNVFAEALCHDSPLRSHAEGDFRKIGHSTTLTEWLDFLIDPHLVQSITDDGIQQLIVLPLEKQSGANETQFEKHIKNLNFLMGAHSGKEMTQFAQKQMSKNEETRKIEEKERSGNQTHLHSSAKFYNSTESLITSLGECCLARHFIDDYRLIQSMLGKEKTIISGLNPLNGAHPVIKKACSWGGRQQKKSCQSDLMSMLLRRAKYLDESKGSCSLIISAEI